MAGIKRIGVDLPDKVTSEDTWLTAELEEVTNSWGFGGTENHFNASSFGNPCDRYHWYAWRGKVPKKKITGKFARLLAAGNAFEDRMEKYLVDINPKTIISRELPTEIDHAPVRITGRIDFLINHLTLGKAVLELKTINEKGFKALKGKPKPEHNLQVQMYLEALNLENGLVAYENKNDSDIKVFRVVRDREYWMKQMERAYRITTERFPPFECTSQYPRYCDCLRAEGVDDGQA